MLDRRGALQALSASSLAWLAPTAFGAPQRQVLRVAGIGTQYFKNSHCDVIFTKIMEGWDHLGFEGPKLEQGTSPRARREQRLKRVRV